jgi:predicted transcriptional regulator
MQCPNMPQSIKDEYKGLKTTRCHSGNASLQYWVTSCHALGMCDTDPDNGIRLRAPPTRDVVKALAEEKKSGIPANASAAAGDSAAFTSQSGAGPTTLAAQVSGPSVASSVTIEPSTTLGPNLVLGSAQSTGSSDGIDLGGVVSGDLQTTPYMALILAQQRPTAYQPADSLGKRRPRPSGFPGMECKHCSSPARVASPGRYFPLTTTVLANNNNPGGCVYVHLMKCGRCPQDVKVRLQRLAERHTLDGENLERGWRRKLFSALWDQLHKGRVWDQDQLTKAHDPTESNVAEESIEDDQQDRTAKEGGDDVGTAALALSTLSGVAGKRKTPPETNVDRDDSL